jgi:hypothetical protein
MTFDFKTAISLQKLFQNHGGFSWGEDEKETKYLMMSPLKG